MKRLEIESPGQEAKAFGEIGNFASRRIKSSPLGVCPVDYTLNVINLAHAQSCGKCTPCRIGLGQLTKLIESILLGQGSVESLSLIEETAKSILDTADCAIGYEAAKIALVSVKNFRAEYLAHINEQQCYYGVRHAIPCTAVCPAHVDVPGYIALVKAGNYNDAVRLIRKDNPFPSVCGYVCEHPCEDICRRGIVDAPVNICGLKRYAVDNAKDIPLPKIAEKTGKKVAIVGGGPGGLTTAYFLTLMGHETVVYEQRHKLGGMLRYGIPDYRLPEDVLDSDIDYILKSGVKVVLDSYVGGNVKIDDLTKEYDAVYISIGAHDDKKIGCPGEDSNNVVSAVKMLRDVGEGNAPNLDGKRVCVVGGGNVAMDATRTSLRLGASHVSCVYRRRIEDMTALTEEIEEAQAEGAEIKTLFAPDHIEADENGNVCALWVQPQIISDVSSDGRTNVKNADKPLVKIPCDYIIVAIGQSIESKHFEQSGILTKRGAIQAEKSCFVPGSKNVFAGGDAVSGPATVIRAVAAGKVAAANIDEFLGFNHKITVDVEVPSPSLTNTPATGRVNLTCRNIEKIKDDFDLVSVGMSEEEKNQECSRCLRCDHFGFGIFKGGRNIEW